MSENNGNVKFIKVRGRVIPIRENRLKKQVAIGAGSGAMSSVGLSLARTGRKKAASVFYAGSFALGLVGDTMALNDSFRVGKKAGFGQGVLEFAKQIGSRMAGSVTGAIAAPLAIKGTAVGLGKTAKMTQKWKFRKAGPLKDVYPSYKSANNILTYRGK